MNEFKPESLNCTGLYRTSTAWRRLVLTSYRASGHFSYGQLVGLVTTVITGGELDGLPAVTLQEMMALRDNPIRVRTSDFSPVLGTPWTRVRPLLH
jgi:hypothetical protein